MEESADASGPSAEERVFLCSGCGAVVAESGVTILPWFNTDLGRYVTTFRCPDCRDASLADSKARIGAATDPDELASAAEMLMHHGVYIHEYLKGEPVEAIKPHLLQCLTLIERGALKLRVDATVPLDLE